MISRALTLVLLLFLASSSSITGAGVVATNAAAAASLLYSSGPSPLTFDGTARNVINLSRSLQCVQGNAARTIFFHIKTTQTTEAHIIATGSSSLTNAFIVVVSARTGIIGVMGYNYDIATGYTYVGYLPSTGTAINDGNWHAVQVTMDGASTLNIFVDGRLDNSRQKTYQTSGDENFIGRSNSLAVGSEYYFIGELKSVQYYSGVSNIIITSSSSGPTVAPSTLAPSTLTPTLRRTTTPSVDPSLSCPAYSASNTSSATINYATCSITACLGDTITMTMLTPGSCSGDTYLRLYDPSTGGQLAENDDYASSVCSQITYTFTAASTCRNYELRKGCYSSGSCGGQVYYIRTVASSSGPTVASSFCLTTTPSTLAPTLRRTTIYH